MKHTIHTSAQLTCTSGDPPSGYSRWRETLQPREALLLVDFQLDEYWHPSAAPRALTAIYLVDGDTLNVAVTDQTLVAESLPPRQQYRHWVARHGLVDFDPSRPVCLQPAIIAKPWGREIWYTGVERRGVCNFASGEARTPIPWLQAALPNASAGAPGEALVLLKILDPSPLPVLGELYFELHESKREVYIVTHIDRRSWPDGVGYIRLGCNQQLIARYATPEEFRADYLEAVLAYESLRRELDALAEAGGTPVTSQLDREQRLRNQMNRFSHLHALRVGDVVQVPPLLPHALQHGVRTIEIQTPTYERKIVSFAQKVLTQDRWDSREAIAQMRLAPPAVAALRVVHSGDGVTVEQIFDCADFEVQRVLIQPGVSWHVNEELHYRLLMVVTGVLELAGTRHDEEQALFLPRLWRGRLAAPEGPIPLVILLVRPHS